MMNSKAKPTAGPNNPRMQRLVVFFLVFAVLLLAQSWAAGAAATAASPARLSARFPAGSIQSVEAAERALVAAGQERAAIESRYAADETACYPKFFATACLDRAKERRRAELAGLRPVEIEANSFKRRARVAEREQALAEQRTREELDPPQLRLDQIKPNITATGKPAIDTPKTEFRDTEARPQRNAAGTRITQHEIKLKRRQKEEIANAKKRAANVSAYEKKVRDAEQHRRAVAARKADKQRGRAAKDPVGAPSECCVKQ